MRFGIAIELILAQLNKPWSSLDAAKDKMIRLRTLYGNAVERGDEFVRYFDLTPINERARVATSHRSIVVYE